MPDDPSQRAARLIGGLIDRGYIQAVGPTMDAIARNGTSGALATRLKQLEDEARRLAEKGEKLTPDNAVVRALMADFEDAMRANRALVSGVAPTVEGQGAAAAGPLVRQMALPGFTDAALAALGVRWNVPDPDAIAAFVNYTGSEAWARKLSLYETGTQRMVQNVLLTGFAEGLGPRAIAERLQAAVEGMPTAYANQLLRTLQLTSLRDGQVAHRMANAAILEYQVRIGVLDDRICSACLALHGTVMEIGERIDGHQQCRCTSITKVKFLPAPTVVSGPEWFEAQSPERQRSILGDARLSALRDGAVKWGDFARPYADPVFGQMVGEASLKGMLGDSARDYYRRN